MAARASRVWMSVAAMAVLAACSESNPVAPADEVYIVSAVYEVRAQGESLVHSGCQMLQGTRDVAFARAGDIAYGVDYAFEADSVDVKVTDDAGIVAERQYDKAFLASGGEDDLLASLTNDLSLRLSIRGSESFDCEDAAPSAE
jgi:hypothetical protein